MTPETLVTGGNPVEKMPLSRSYPLLIPTQRSKHADGWHKPKKRKGRDRCRAAARERHGPGTAAQRRENGRGV